METVIYSTLQEEKKRNLEMQKTYSQQIKSLPKGTIFIKTISGNNYYYLKYRQKNKVKTDYLGKDENAAQDIAKKIEERKHLQEIIKRLKLEYKQICKIVKD